MFKKDSQGNTYYLSSKTNIEYSLLVGMTDQGYTSDIVFIFREANSKEMENGYFGEVISWVYDGFSDLKYLETKIKEYEQNI